MKNISAVAMATKYTPDSVLEIPEALLISLIGVLVVMFELALLAIFILLMSKVFKNLGKKNKGETQETPEVVVPSGTPLPETDSAGKLDLVDVDEPTAAVIMAIVSDQSGIPLNRLSFKSIKKLEDENK